MRIFLSGLIIVLGSAAALAQGARRAIVWSGDPGCGFKSRSLDKLDTIRCGTIPTDRGPVSIITYDGVTLAAAFLKEEDRFVAGVHIKNDTDGVIGFDSDRWGAAHFASRENFAKREKPLLAETSIPSRDLVRRMASGTRLENSLGDFMSDMHVEGETREIRRSDGTKYRTTVIVPDKNAAVTEERVGKNRTEISGREQRDLRDNALTAKYVRAGDSVKGLVYFRRVDIAEFVVYSMNVADVTFVFMVPWPSK